MASNTELANVPLFKYLGGWMAANDSDHMAITQNIAKARAQWGQLCRLLTRRGASHRLMGMFTKQRHKQYYSMVQKHGR